MKISDLRQAVEQIELDDASRQKMVSELKKQRRMSLARGKRGYRRAAKIAAAAAACALAVGLVSIPVRALVNSFVQERMEEIPKEEVKATVEMIDKQAGEGVDADGFSRAYTKEEKERHAELFTQYMKGTFPEGEVLQVDSEAEAKEHEFCYLTVTSTFYLPKERDLTDEELLEIIDFNRKRDYALQQRYEEENAEEIAAKKEKEKKQIAETVASGGITEQEAIDIAGGYLQKVFGISGDGMEFNHYYSEPGEMFEEASYGVNWGIRSHEHYYFFISAIDGEPLEISFSSAAWLDEENPPFKPSVQEAPGVALSLKEKAGDFLKDAFGIDEEFEQVKSYYYLYGEEELNNIVYILFEKADGSAYSLKYRWDGSFAEFRQATVEEYEENIMNMQEYLSKDLTEERGEEITVTVVQN